MGYAGRLTEYLTSTRLKVGSGSNASIRMRIPHLFQRLSAQQAQGPHLTILADNNKPLGYILLGANPLTIGRSGCAINIAKAAATIKGYNTTYNIPPEIATISFNGDSLKIGKRAASNLVRVYFEDTEIPQGTDITSAKSGNLQIRFMHPEIPGFAVATLKTRLTIPREQVEAFSGKPVTWRLEGSEDRRAGRTWQATAFETTAVVPEKPQVAPAPAPRPVQILPPNVRLHLPISRININVFGSDRQQTTANYFPSSNPRENSYFLTRDGKTLYRIDHGAVFTFGISGPGPSENNLLLNFFPSDDSLGLRARTTARRETIDSNEQFATHGQMSRFRVFVQLSSSASTRGQTFEIMYGSPKFFGPGVVEREASELKDFRI